MTPQKGKDARFGHVPKIQKLISLCEMYTLFFINGVKFEKIYVENIMYISAFPYYKDYYIYFLASAITLATAATRNTGTKLRLCQIHSNTAKSGISKTCI